MNPETRPSRRVHRRQIEPASRTEPASPEAALEEVPPLLFIRDAQVPFVLQQLLPGRHKSRTKVEYKGTPLTQMSVLSGACDGVTAASSVRPRALREREARNADKTGKKRVRHHVGEKEAARSNL